ncbi:MAG: NTP transferase domain-containing protein [Alphaproteobacteria bacterium]|nr:NTP transferase domain-containing protein [Alphaproteobacteria bacterium]
MSQPSRIQQAAILCGGRGTRLGALAAGTPKPLLPVGGRPFLELLLGRLRLSGIRRVLLLAGFAADRILDYIAANAIERRFGISVEVAIEPFPAGTGGALWHARHALDEQFFLLNGDSWFDMSLAKLAERLAIEPAAIGVLALRRLDDTGRYGTVAVSGDSIVRFAERPARPTAGLINGGIYTFRRSLLDHLRECCSLEGDALPPLARAGALRGIVFDGYFIDIGVPEDLARAERELPKAAHALVGRAARRRRAPPQGRRLNAVLK